MSSSQYRQILTQHTTKYSMLCENQAQQKKNFDKFVTEIEALTDARTVVNNVMIATQISISSFIEEVVSLALKTVFGNEYGFKVQYEIKRGKSEANLFVLKGDEMLNAEDSCGGGILDVCAFALRTALYALADPKPEPVLVFDEPFRFVSKDLSESCARMVKEVSDLLGVQILMVSHNQDLIESADKAFRVTQVDGVSEVKECQ